MCSDGKRSVVLGFHADDNDMELWRRSAGGGWWKKSIH
jgi:hypothetical protein